MPAGRCPLGARYLDELYEAALLALNSQRVIIDPFERLHLLPLAAAYNAPQKRYFAQECLLSFVPSPNSLVCGKSAGKAHGSSNIERLLTVAYPGKEGAKDYWPNRLMTSDENSRRTNRRRQPLGSVGKWMMPPHIPSLPTTPREWGKRFRCAPARQ